MDDRFQTIRFLRSEALALLCRLETVRPFSLTMPSVAAAQIAPNAFQAIEVHLVRQRSQLKQRILMYLDWLNQTETKTVSSVALQQRLTLLRLYFNAVLSQLDIFADVLTQRAEHDLGIWLGAFDRMASDALKIKGYFYDIPPLMTYVDRGQGAAIRRIQTRLPGKVKSPVTIIRIPRERLIGSAIASSLCHEMGHQGAALLNLVPSFRLRLQKRIRQETTYRQIWILFEKWISEILSDLWSVAKLGITSTLGLIGVVSLPRAFVFRIDPDDPHPFPWIRVKISCAIGDALYPDSQWEKLTRLWERLYPKKNLDSSKTALIGDIETNIPGLVRILLQHKPHALKGKTLSDVFAIAQTQPNVLRRIFQTWQTAPTKSLAVSPVYAFAVVGQARADQTIDPQAESRFLEKIFQYWSLSGRLGGPAASRLLEGKFR